ncbi:leukotriene-B4 omega-hydroxylase 3 [Favolaschia claudopus]|uniref:Leukotriene-B4 omega-hydroxylase 3 n=1 Tax=Favolaschia claudopus TaxID=2862362 RepID=A0AAW0DLT6_9AGAR
MLVTIVSVAAAIVVYRFITNLASVNYEPGMRPLFSPLGLFGAIIPTYWWNPGLRWVWEWRNSNFRNHEYDVVSLVPILMGNPYYYTCSVDVVKQLLNNELWGENIISANDDMWKRHRRILSPALTFHTYSLVVSETIAVYREMVTAEGWQGRDTITIADVSPLPHKLALNVIARCGFGLGLPWVDPHPQKNEMSFGESLTIVSSSAIARLILPSCAYKLPIPRVRSLDRAWKTLATFMNDLVDRREAELDEHPVDNDQSEGGDIFSRLVGAMSVDEATKLALKKQEVIGNTFALMFAGRETTACALVATLGFLAIHQEHQAAAYAEIMANLPSHRDPVLEDLSKLPHLLACYHEAIRMYPGGAMLTREMAEDVSIKISRPVERTMVLKKGALMVVEMIAVHHNPHFFPDPDEFRPSRWYNVLETDIPMFGFGPRACVGKKFSHVEAMCFLSLFLRDWKLDIPLAAGETRVEYETRTMGRAGQVGMAFGCGPVALSLSRRG